MPYKIKGTVISINSLLKVDGRKRVAASTVLGPIREQNFSVAMIRHVIDHFLRSDDSSHSSNRGMLGFIIDYCEENAISYTLQAAFDSDGRRAGYYIKRVENFDLKKAISEQEP